MTPAQIEDAVRARYNSIGDSFYSQDEILGIMYDACLELARECLIIESTSLSIASGGSQQLSYPSNVIAIKRITFNGKKLKPITFREDDAITGLNASTTDSGVPQFYSIWNNFVYFRPIPSDDGTVNFFTYNEPSVITSGSTLEIPTMFHMSLVDYIVAEMAAKDLNFSAAQYYTTRWERKKLDVKRWSRKRLRGDSFNVVQDEASMIEGYLGIV